MRYFSQGNHHNLYTAICGVYMQFWPTLFTSEGMDETR
jgi:hypothetical protein